MTETDLLLERLRQRRVVVDLTTASGTPLKAATVYGRCISALSKAGVPEDEREAFALRAGAHVRQTAGEQTQRLGYGEAVADLMNRYDAFELLRVASEYLEVRVNWAVAPAR